MFDFSSSVFFKIISKKYKTKLILKYFTSPLKKNPQNTKELNKIIEEMDKYTDILQNSIPITRLVDDNIHIVHMLSFLIAI